MKILEYKTIVYDKLVEFNNACNSMVSEGYTPFGGVALNQYAYGQTFVKYDVDDYMKQFGVQEELITEEKV